MHLLLQPDSSISAIEGQGLTVRCVSNMPVTPFSLYWMADGKNIQGHLTTRTVDSKISELHIREVEKSDAGKYRCFFNDSGIYINQTLTIWVHSKESEAFCHHTQFRCSSQNHCIFSRYRCDGYEDCPDKSDEVDCKGSPCAKKFNCSSGRCINFDRVCDKNHDNDCGDWSDEHCLIIPPPDNPSIVSEEPDTTKDNNMTWLKTTVYSVIGCAVGVVLFISVVVIFFFRLKMRKAERRRALRAIERRRQLNQASNNNSNHGLSENEPFISPSGGNFGNIFVNVNNGVQYVPGADSTVGLVAPPSYSEVVQESRQQQGSPPPPYSTFDRNVSRSPTRMLEIDTNTSNLELNRTNELYEDMSTEITVVRDRDTQTMDRRHVPITDAGSRSDSSRVGGSADGDTTLENGSCSRAHNIHLASEVEPTSSMNKQKQSKIEVRGGQIILADEQSPSTSAHDLPCSIVITSDDDAKPASQLLVRDGQIILANTESLLAAGVNENANSNKRDSRGATSQGQLEVKDGNIVFKNGS